MPNQPAPPAAGEGFNAVNRGVYIADNLDFLRSLNTGCIDLVNIDPPFAKNDTFTGNNLKPPLSDAEIATEQRLLARWGIQSAEQARAAGITWPELQRRGAGYKDYWNWDDDVHSDWVTSIEATHPAVSKLLDATRHIHGEDTAAYLCFMAIRLIEIHRVLKPTGSLYLHCDHSANAYLRQLLDGIFGNGEGNKPGFRNEIIWSHQGSWVQPEDHFPRRHDTILWYTKSKQYTFHPGYEDDAVSQMNYKRWQKFLTPDNQILGRHMPDHDKRFATYLNAFRKKYGREPQDDDVVMEITGSRIGTVQYVKVVDPKTPERTGYPTQKPVALAERTIKASSNPGDIVLDCFAGCAYTALAAERLGRRWVACDQNTRAWTVVKRQFNKPQLAVLACNDEVPGQQVLTGQPAVTVHGPAQLPHRVSPVEYEVKELKPQPRSYKQADRPLMGRQEMLEALLGLSHGQAWCCGLVIRNEDGSLDYGNYQLDHIIPKSVGGDDDIKNRAPLCPAHNLLKSARDIDLEELRTEVMYLGEGKVHPRTLPKLSEMYRESSRIWQEAYNRKNSSLLV